MQTVVPSRLLRFALAVDAVGSGALGVLQVSASAALAGLLGLGAAAVLGTGVFMLLYAAALAVFARSGSLARALIWAIVIGNAGWAVGCVALALGGAGLTGLGMGYLLLQAVAVAAFAGLQAAGLTQSSPAVTLRPQRA